MSIPTSACNVSICSTTSIWCVHCSILQHTVCVTKLAKFKKSIGNKTESSCFVRQTKTNEHMTFVRPHREVENAILLQAAGLHLHFISTVVWIACGPAGETPQHICKQGVWVCPPGKQSSLDLYLHIHNRLHP